MSCTFTVSHGLPIALNLIGLLLSQDKGLSLGELLAELADPDNDLTQLSVGDEPTLASVFEAGYRRLSEFGKRCYRAVGLMPGADIPVGALGAALGLSGLRIRSVVGELVVRRIVEQPEPGRIVVHNLAREHARNVPAAVDTAASRVETQRAILDWYAATSIAADIAIELGGLVELARANRAEALRLLRRNLELAEQIGGARRIALACLHLAKAEEPAAA